MYNVHTVWSKKKNICCFKSGANNKKKIAKLNFSNFFPCLYNVKVAEAKRKEINVGFLKFFFATDSMHHILYIHLHQMDVAGSLTSTEKWIEALHTLQYHKDKVIYSIIYYAYTYMLYYSTYLILIRKRMISKSHFRTISHRQFRSCCLYLLGYKNGVESKNWKNYI